MSLRTLLYSLQVEYGSKTSYNLIVLITISIFMFSMINYQSISAISTNPKISNDKATNPKISNDKATNPKISNDKATNPKISNDKATNPKISNDKATNPKISNPDPTLVPFTSHYADTLDNSNNPTDIPFP
jgi:hypothetical protein